MKNVTETKFLVVDTNNLPEDIRDDLLEYCPSNDSYVQYWIERPATGQADVDSKLWSYIDGDSQDKNELTLLLRWSW